MTETSPKVAMNSLRNCAPPARAWREAKKIGSPNMPWATATPRNAPVICAAMYTGTSVHRMPPTAASASVTAGFICAPESGPNAKISATSAAPVANVFASNAMATFPPARRSPMMPEPTTVARSSAVATNSATARRDRRACVAALTGRPPDHAP